LPPPASNFNCLVMKSTVQKDCPNEQQKYPDSNEAGKARLDVSRVTVDANTTSGLNITAEYDYDILGRVSEANDPNGAVTAFVYNAFDKLVKMTTPTGGVTHYTYNDCKKLSSIERDITGEPNQVAGFTYDILDHLKTITSPLGYITTNSYDYSENISSVMDAEGKVAQPQYQTGYEYNERDLLWKVTDANGGITEYSYDKNGNLEWVKDAKGRFTSYEYDGFDRLITITYPDNSSEQFTYDKNSNVLTYTNRKGQITTCEYDALNRLTHKEQGTQRDITFDYDVAGRLNQVDDNSNITTYAYDRVGRVKEVTDPYDRTVKYEYDSSGRRTKLIYPEGGSNYIQYSYHADDRLDRVYKGTSTYADYGYDELGRRNTVATGAGGWSYEFKLNDRLESITDSFSSDNSISFDYTYDKAGNRLSMEIDGGNQHDYTYDKIYRLNAVDYPVGDDAAYYYDSVGNRTSMTKGTTTSYTANNLNEYVTVGTTTYSYDQNGNLFNDGTYKYYYDYENRLTDVNDQSNNHIASYKYDYTGRRIEKLVYGSPNVVTRYCYDGDNLIGEYDGSGNLLRKYIYGDRIDEPICITTSQGTFYYAYDGLGSVIAISDDEGNIVEKYSYDVFGKPTIRDAQGNIISTSAYGNRFMFTGRECDYETGNYYYRARYYNPVIGRFLQPDPIQSEINLYPYCGNNPVIYIDPYGLAEVLSRPLESWWGQQGAKVLYGKGDEGGEHWQIFYNDGTNSGYFGNSPNGPVFRSEKSDLLQSHYNVVWPNKLDDVLMHRAENIVQERWQKEYKEGKRRYKHPYNDCHTYVNDVTYEYLKLKKAKKENSQKESSKK